MDEMFKGPIRGTITIDLGDYKISITGDIETPLVKSHVNNYEAWKMGPDVYKQINFCIVPRSDVYVEKVRWVIPIAIKPRIES